jgi:hypothetical protein
MDSYIKEFTEHLDNITKDVLDEAHDGSSADKKLAMYGRILMDQAVTTKDDALSNMMAKVGDALTRYNTTFGARSLEELCKKTDTTPNIIKKLLAFAEKIHMTKGALNKDQSDGGLDDEGDDDFTQASDDEMAAMADKAAMRKMRK